MNGIAEASVSAFKVGLAVQSSKFWVNLNPSEPERICDPDLSRTDVARVLLEADYQMKRDAAAITDPRKSELGKEYWKRIEGLMGKANGVSKVRQGTRF